MERSTKGGNSYEALFEACGPDTHNGRADRLLRSGYAHLSGYHHHLRRDRRLITLALAGLAGMAGIAALPIRADLDALLAFGWLRVMAWCMCRANLRPALSRGCMAERQNVIVLDRATWEQVRRAALKLDSKKFPRHAEILARREAELRRERKAA